MMHYYINDARLMEYQFILGEWRLHSFVWLLCGGGSRVITEGSTEVRGVALIGQSERGSK